MLSLDPNTVRALAPWLERVLIVDRSPDAARLLADLICAIYPGRVSKAASTDEGLVLAETCSPQIMFVELRSAEVDGAAFTRRLRRSALACREAPVIITSAGAPPRAAAAARDAGAHEILRKPFSFADLVARLEAAALRERTWVEAMGYVGPDRRRFNSGAYSGRRKRRTDAVGGAEQARIVQALTIIAAALPMLELDRLQAFRTIKAQTGELQRIGTIANDPELVQAALALHRLLNALDSPQALTHAGVDLEAQKLLAFLPPELEPRRRPVAA